MRTPRYQLPHYLYFIDDIRKDNELVKIAIVLKLDYELTQPFGSDKEEDKYLDVKQSYYLVSPQNIDDLVISINLISIKHCKEFKDVITSTINKGNLSKEDLDLYHTYVREYYHTYSQEIKSHFADNEPPPEKHAKIAKEILSRIGYKESLKYEDLRVFLPYIFTEMANKSKKRMNFFEDQWKPFYRQNVRYKPSERVQNELNNLERILRPLNEITVTGHFLDEKI